MSGLSRVATPPIQGVMLGSGSVPGVRGLCPLWLVEVQSPSGADVPGVPGPGPVLSPIPRRAPVVCSVLQGGFLPLLVGVVWWLVLL